MPFTSIWHIGAGEDAKNIADAINQLESDSDRSVAIVAHSIVDTRLYSAIKRGLIDSAKSRESLFGVSRPLAGFDAKIELAFLLGLISDTAKKDLSTFNTIRNRFAHKLEIRDFQSEAIVALCKNLVLVDSYIDEPTDTPHRPTIALSVSVPGSASIEPNYSKPNRPIEMPVLRFPGAKDALSKPRSRYFYSAELFNYALSTLRWKGHPEPRL